MWAASGNLLLDSPSCDSLFGRIFTPQEHQQLRLLHQYLFLQNSFEEKDLHRPARMRFNPKPCRVCQILFKETGNTDFETYISAMLSTSLPEYSWSDKYTPDQLDAALAATELHNSFIEANTLRTSTKEAPSKTVQIALVLLLDTIRHFGMRKNKVNSTHLETQLANTTLRSHYHSQETTRLWILIDAAFERFTRHTTVVAEPDL